MYKKIYRVVVDFGYEDKAWMERFLFKKEALKALIQHSGCDDSITFEEAMDNDRLYYIEEDHYDDKEDWDWMNS